MNNEIRKEVERSLKFLKEDTNLPDNQDNNQNLEDFIVGLIKANICSTIGIKYEGGIVYVTCVYPQQTKLIQFDQYDKTSYDLFCKEILQINLEEEYNCCRTCSIGGVNTRIYAMMPPFTKSPNITISTTKIPPEKLEKQSITDEQWNQIVHSNFIIVGPSGSGKTYLMNYLLNKYIKSNERLAIIEEFGELIPPNPLTISVLVPPPKPNQKHLLQFVTEQTNLMRLDMTCVGEVKGAEAWPLIVQGASGTRIAATLHGDNTAAGLNRLRALCQQSCDNVDAINEFIAKGIKYVIIMRNKQIVKVEKLMGTHNHNNFAAQEIYS